MVQQLAVHPGRSHHLRVQSLLELLAQRLAQNEDAAHLDAAAGASGTGTNEHQHHQHFLGQSGPQVKIAAGKKPVVVMMEPTWNAACRSASPKLL